MGVESGRWAWNGIVLLLPHTGFSSCDWYRARGLRTCVLPNSVFRISEVTGSDLAAVLTRIYRSFLIKLSLCLKGHCAIKTYRRYDIAVTNCMDLIIGFCILLRVILTINNTFCFATIDKVFYYVASVLTTYFGPDIRPSSCKFKKY
jgi:hypothetical protein